MLTDLYYNGKWIVAKHHSSCKCGNHISPGDDIWYIPIDKKVSCAPCKRQTYPKELKELLGYQ
jgi:hypothetical protein